MKYQILNRYDLHVQFELECESLKDAVVAAVKGEANLRGADLYGADLRETNLRKANLYGANLRETNLRGANLREADLRKADLYGADLRGANLYGADLGETNLYGANLGEKIGKLKANGYFFAGYLGSRNDVLMAFHSDKGVFVRTGCFTGSLDEFRAAVIKTHGETSKHGKLYLGIANIIEYKFSEA